MSNRKRSRGQKRRKRAFRFQGKAMSTTPETAKTTNGESPATTGDAMDDDRLRQRELLGVITVSALELVERFGWTRARVASAVDYELRELVVDSAADDLVFREWYGRWRKENPG